jgi:hypothetical protein
MFYLVRTLPKLVTGVPRPTVLQFVAPGIDQLLSNNSKQTPTQCWGVARVRASVLSLTSVPYQSTPSLIELQLSPVRPHTLVVQMFPWDELKAHREWREASSYGNVILKSELALPVTPFRKSFAAVLLLLMSAIYAAFENHTVVYTCL